MSNGIGKDDPTPQEIFDFVAAKLLDQKEQSVGACNLCQYRGKNGNKCAVGHLIPDEMYQSGMDNNGIDSSVGYIVANYTVPKYFPKHAALLGALQSVHDKPYVWGADRLKMCRELREVAQAAGLNDEAIVHWEKNRASLA